MSASSFTARLVARYASRRGVTATRRYRLERMFVSTAMAIVLSGCGGAAGAESQSAPGSQSAPDRFVAACEGDVGSRIEAHCDCVQSSVQSTVSQTAIQRELGNIRAGNPPVWFMKAAGACP